MEEVVILKFSGGSGKLTNIYDLQRTLMEEVVTFKFSGGSGKLGVNFQEEVVNLSLIFSNT